MRSLLLALCAALVCACPASRGASATADADAGPLLSVGAPTPVMPLDHPPAVDPFAGTSSAQTRRLSVAQLRASVPVVLRGQTWKLGAGNGFDARAATLGVPDYVSSVEESLEATPLYLKFMGDMARDACSRAVAADAAQADEGLRAVLRFAGPTDTVGSSPDKVDQNLRYLLLAFLGQHVDATDTAALAPLRTLFDHSVAAAAGNATPGKAHVLEGWRTVCVALLTSPEFHLY